MSRLCSGLGAVAVSALLCSSALGASPERTAATLAQSVDSAVRDAQVMRSQKDYAGAIKILSQLMLIAADDPRVVGEYGKVLVQQGRSSEALDFLGRAVQLQSNDWTLYSALGVAYDQKADYDRAATAYQRALQLKPGESVVLNNYAMSRLQAGDLARARTLIADAATASQDERVARNRDMIYAMKAPETRGPAVATAQKPSATTSPRPLARTLTPAEGRTVMMQAVPHDPLAGPVGKPKPKKTASAKPSGKKAKSDIPALRLTGDSR